MFSEGVLLRVVKSQDCMVKGQLGCLFCCDISIIIILKSVPNDKILHWSKLKAFADDKIKVLKMFIFVVDRLKTLWEKEKMLVTIIFSFPHTVFKRPLILKFGQVSNVAMK